MKIITTADVCLNVARGTPADDKPMVVVVKPIRQRKARRKHRCPIPPDSMDIAQMKIKGSCGVRISGWVRD